MADLFTLFLAALLGVAIWENLKPAVKNLWRYYFPGRWPR